MWWRFIRCFYLCEDWLFILVQILRMCGIIWQRQRVTPNSQCNTKSDPEEEWCVSYSMLLTIVPLIESTYNFVAYVNWKKSKREKNWGLNCTQNNQSNQIKSCVAYVVKVMSNITSSTITHCHNNTIYTGCFGKIANSFLQLIKVTVSTIFIPNRFPSSPHY